jgi:hypothetical protein
MDDNCVNIPWRSSMFYYLWVAEDASYFYFVLDFFFERKCGRGSPYNDFGFLKIRTQIHIYGDLNLSGWVVHPLP